MLAGVSPGNEKLDFTAHYHISYPGYIDNHEHPQKRINYMNHIFSLHWNIILSIY